MSLQPADIDTLIDRWQAYATQHADSERWARLASQLQAIVSSGQITYTAHTNPLLIRVEEWKTRKPCRDCRAMLPLRMFSRGGYQETCRDCVRRCERVADDV